MKNIAQVVVSAIVTFFASLELIQFAARVPTPSLIMHKETAFLAFLFQHVMLAVFVAVLIGAPLGYFIKDRVILSSFLAVLPTPILFGFFSTWPANKLILIVGYIIMILLFCASACLTHRLTRK